MIFREFHRGFNNKMRRNTSKTPTPPQIPYIARFINCLKKLFAMKLNSINSTKFNPKLSSHFIHLKLKSADISLLILS